MLSFVRFRRSGRIAFLALLGSLLFSAAETQAHGPWVTFKDCQLLPNASNDGDSFHVRANGQEYIFRIYFVDAPETDPHLEERLQEQAKYFGISVPEALQAGEVAEKFTKAKLARPFVVRTCMQDALGRSRLERFYAFIEAGGTDLGEELVRNGLARLHGTATKPPGMISPQVEWAKLGVFEAEARREKIGGWGAHLGRMNVRAREPIKAGSSSFDAFFHTDRTSLSLSVSHSSSPSPTPTPAVVVAPTITKTPAPPTPAPSLSSAKLNVNTATLDQLRAAGISAMISARIIEARPFKTADDLHNIKGVGVKTYARIRPAFE